MVGFTLQQRGLYTTNGEFCRHASGSTSKMVWAGFGSGLTVCDAGGEVVEFLEYVGEELT